MKSEPARGGLDVDRYAARIRGFDGSRFEVATEATLSHRDHAYPILSVRSRGPATRTLLVLAGVHGDEQAGLLAVPFILDAWCSAHVRLVVVTPVNPVGAAKRSRRNAEGRDINRDFVRFATPEARVVRDVFQATRPDFVVSLHEGPQRGAFMFANRHVARPLTIALSASLAEGGTELAERDYFGVRLRPPGVSPASATTLAVWKVWALAFRQQASLVYSQDRAVPEIVLESSSRSTDEAVRIRPHVDLVAALAARL